MGELSRTMRDAATTLLLLLSTFAVVSSREGFPWSLLLQRLRSSRQGGRDSFQSGRDVGNNDDNEDNGEEMNIKMLRMSVPGEPGVDYPILATVPSTSFSCVGKAEGGYYADMETGCQVVHTCGGGSKVVNKFSFIKYSTLCSNGTIYSQEMGTCHWWYLLTAKAQKNTISTRTTSELIHPSRLSNRRMEDQVLSPVVCRCRMGKLHLKAKEEDYPQATSSLSTVSLLSEAKVSPWSLSERCLQSGFQAPRRTRSIPT